MDSNISKGPSVIKTTRRHAIYPSLQTFGRSIQPYKIPYIVPSLLIVSRQYSVVLASNTHSSIQLPEFL